MALDTAIMEKMAQDIFEHLGQAVTYERPPLLSASVTAVKGNMAPGEDFLPHLGSSAQAVFTVSASQLEAGPGPSLWPPEKGDCIIEADSSRWYCFHVEEAPNGTARLFCSRDVGVQP